MRVKLALCILAICSGAALADDGVIRPTVESLAANVQQLQSENAKLKAENAKLKTEIARLEKLVPSTKPALEPVKKKEEPIYGHTLVVDAVGPMADGDFLKILEIADDKKSAVCQWRTGSSAANSMVLSTVIVNRDFSKNADGELVPSSDMGRIKVVEVKKSGNNTYKVIESVK